MYLQMMKVFGYILNFLKKQVMGFTASNIVVNNEMSPKVDNYLNQKEIEVLLSLIKRSTFLGEDIESLYNLVIKLQNQYIEQTK